VQQNLAPVTDFMNALPTGEQDDPATDGHLWRPFFLMYSPNVPHHGFLTSQFFREHYCTDSSCARVTTKAMRTPNTAKYLANVEILDYGLSVVLNHLKRSCVCDEGVAKSLYDTAIIVFFSDNGWMLPESKGARNKRTLRGENGFRTPLIVSLPEHRLAPGTPGRIAPAIFSQQLVHVADVTRTLLHYGDGYVDTPTGKQPTNTVPIPWDLRGTDLRDVITQSSTAPVRDVLIGQWNRGRNPDVLRNQWFLVTRPGVVGVCITGTNPPNPGPVTTFCLTDADCSSGYACHRQDDPSAEPKSKVCMNRPAQACDSDDDCHQLLCSAEQPHTCLAPAIGGSGPPDKYGFKDFQGRNCATGGDQVCRPDGICQAPVLRYAVKVRNGDAGAPDFGNVQIQRVYLLTSDPDETTDLSSPAEGLNVPPSVQDKLRGCVASWEVWKPGQPPTTCAAPLGLKYGG
jgi:hypothetical protein